MSFWKDLQDMKTEIDELDQKSSRLSKSDVNSSSRSITQSVHKSPSQRKNGRPSARVRKQVERLIGDAEKSYDANMQLMQHLGVLEKEISKLTEKEQRWNSAAKEIHNEVSTLHQQIGSIKRQASTTNVGSVGGSHHRSGAAAAAAVSSTSYNYGANTGRHPSLCEYSSAAQKKKKTTQSTAACEYRADYHYHSRETGALKSELLLAKRENNRLTVENNTLQQQLQKAQHKASEDLAALREHALEADNGRHGLQRRCRSLEENIDNLKGKLADVAQQNQMLRSVADSYERLKDSDSKLQMEHQKALQDMLELRRTVSALQQRLHNADGHVQETDIKLRQVTNDKMNALSELRALRSVYEQEQKRSHERYEREVKKLEAELSYAKKMYQEMKRQYRELLHNFENEQPQFDRLREDLDREREAFQQKMSDILNTHVTRLDVISKESEKVHMHNKEMQNRIKKAGDNAIGSSRETHEIVSMSETHAQGTGIQKAESSKGVSQGRRLTAIWEPSRVSVSR